MIKKFIVTIILTLSILCSGFNLTRVEAKEDMNSEISAQELVDKMGVGWNLGNSLDAYNYGNGYDSGLKSETYWGNPKTTKKMIDTVAKAGFKSIRIPVTYYNHLDKNKNIDSKWLDRVEEVVNYALDNDLYVVLNIHHDTGMDGWIHADTDTYKKDSPIFKNLWNQIANRFKNYDERLLFEGTNEIINTDKNWDWGVAWKDFRVVHDLNQDFINTVRSTGGNNSQRFLVLSTWGACSDSCQIEQLFYKKFSDTAKDKLIFSVHNYTGTPSKIDPLIESIDKYSTKYKMPVIIDEFGTTAGQNESFRITSAKKYVSKAKECGITCFVWDDGASYKLLDRKTCTWRFPKIVEAIVEASKVDNTQSTENKENTEIKIVNFKDIDFNKISNWRNGHYSNKTGLYESYSGRICLNSYVNLDNEEYIVKAPENYHVLIREMDKDNKFLRSLNLANGDTYTISKDASFVGISLYNDAHTDITMDTYKSLLENSKITFAKNNKETTNVNKEITILDSMYSKTKNFTFTNSDIKITNETIVTLEGTVNTLAYGDIFNAASGKYVFRMENTNGIYRRMSWWNDKVSNVKANAKLVIKQNGRYTTVSLNDETKKSSMSTDIPFTGTGFKLNMNLISLKELKIEDKNGVLIKDYVPALDKEGKPCIYDKVNNSCYYFKDTSSLVYNKKENDSNNKEVTVLNSMYSKTKNFTFTNSDIKITNETIVTLEGTVNTVTYGDIFNAADGKYVFRIENTNGIYRRMSWWNDKVSNVKANAKLVIKQNGRYTTVSLNDETKKSSMSTDIPFSGTGFKLNMNLISLKELKIEDKNGVLIKDYVPALDKEGKPCIYDKVNNSFHYFKDTSSLIYK